MYIDLWWLLWWLMTIYWSGAISLFMFILCCIPDKEDKEVNGRGYGYIPLLWPLLPFIIMIYYMAEQEKKAEERRKQRIVEGEGKQEELFPTVSHGVDGLFAAVRGKPEEKAKDDTPS